MKSLTLKTLALIACLTLSQTALARQVAVCLFVGFSGVYPTDTLECKIGNDDNYKETTLFEMTKAGWSIQAVTPVTTPGGIRGYVYLEKP